MLVMLGASASGKTEIGKTIIKRYKMKKMITYTTRPMRIGEVDAVDYYFLSCEDFLKLEKEGFFIETTLYNGNYYGTAFKDASEDKVLIVDMNGANVFDECLQERVIIFYLEASETIRRKRMFMRGDKEEDITRRLKEDANVFIKEKLNRIDYVINTEDKDLEVLAEEIYSLYIDRIRIIE